MLGLIKANLHYLRQAADLVDALEDGSYIRQEPMFYNSTVGGHLRHCLDHYESFTAGIDAGKIDYDARCRDRQVEHKTCAARKRIDRMSATLEQLEDTHLHTQVQVKVDCGCTDQGADLQEKELWQKSTIGRELQFLISHTVHHFAMIRGICQTGGHELAADFGYAPSTLRHRENHSIPIA